MIKRYSLPLTNLLPTHIHRPHC